MFNCKTSILAGLTALFSTCASAQTSSTGDAVFNPPKLKHFVHVDIVGAFPINSTTIYGAATQVPNMGGNITGAIEGTLIPVGASYETLAPGRDDIGFYENRFTVNTTQTTLFMDVRATMQYANNALHGFGSATFTTDGGEDNQYAYINFGNFVAEIEADFKAGRSEFDVFELETGGRIDGEPIKALLPPGEA